MAISQSECESALAAMSAHEEAHFLAHLGHWLTVVARGAYEFQAPGVKDPIALRHFNEVHHRVYAQLQSLIVTGQRQFDPQSLASWLSGEERPPEFRAGCLWAFEKSLEHVRRST